ncbi:MAG: repeat protein [Planctomycetaceae bacterium]|nr:repeat protein [Planctomycetaceae bacterium]
MSRHSRSSSDWRHAAFAWLTGSTRLKREADKQHPEAAVVEYLEERQLLTSISGAGSVAEQLAADSVSPSTLVDTDQALAMAVQSDGKIVLVGAAETDTNGGSDFAVTRLNADGSLDTTFGTNGKLTIAFDLGGDKTDVATCVAIQTDGKIVVGGFSQVTISGNFDFSAARLNANGTLDPAFGTNGKTTVAFDSGGNDDDRASGLAIQSDGKIVIVGYTTRSFNGNCDFAITRLNANGQLDTTFSDDGKKMVDFHGGDDLASAVAVQPNGRSVVVGSASQAQAGYDFAIVRITPTGSLDRSFTGDGKKTFGFNRGGSRNDVASSVALQADGGIVLSGTSDSSSAGGDFAVARLKASGSLDTHFGTHGRETVGFDLGAGNDDEVTGVALQSDGKIVLAGFTQRNDTGDFDFAAVRLNTNGDLDTSFSTDGKQTVPLNLGGTNTDLVRAVVIQSDGKILLAGSALKTNPANADFAIARLNTDGGVDNTFGTNGIKTVPFDLN